MKRASLLIGIAMMLTSALVLAQQGPESVLPPGFDKPAPREKPRAAEPGGVPKPAGDGAGAAIGGPGSADTVAAPPIVLPATLPSIDKLAAMTPEQLAELLSNKPKIDMPPGARRDMKHLGVIDESEGGLPSWTLARQNASLVGAVIAGNNGQIISRWGHILLRRALSSRLDAPAGMQPADFVAMRTALLVRMGEGPAARALAQDVDTANYNALLTQTAIDAYIASGDFTGACPVVTWQGGVRKDQQWRALQAICNAFSSGGTRGMTELDRIAPGSGLERIDLLLAQKYAGSAGRAQRAVTIEWDNVEGLTAWRYGLALAVGLEPPAGLLASAPASLRGYAATSPSASLTLRAAAADQAAAAGVLSSAAMVDLYSQMYSAGGSGDWADRAGALQSAYLATAPADRLASIKQLWGVAGSPEYYSRQVLTAYAAARLPIDTGWSGDAPGLIASMLAAGLDANALRWGPVVPDGSDGWAMLTLVQPARRGEVSSDQVASFRGNDKSDEARRTQFLIAGLAGLGRLPMNSANDLAKKYAFTLDRPSRWTALIDKAAEVGNPTLVALLAGAGMQGSGWNKMTARNLYHIVAALNRVGLESDARMIAAEAVARG
ncbi:MAG: hypothetical protein ABIW31_09060 [Novosphingobium sp.]